MLFSYDKDSKQFVVHEETDFATHNIFERRDIQSWIEENSHVLGEELYIITTEYSKFDKTNERFDLLALDTQGTLVVIELKRDDSGKSVDLQAIKYAAYCSTLTLDDIVDMNYKYLNSKSSDIQKNEVEAQILDFISDSDFKEINDKPRIILVSREFRAEVTASVLWLRKFELDITCVKISPYLNDSKITMVSSVIIPLPEAKDYIIRKERKEKKEGEKLFPSAEYQMCVVPCGLTLETNIKYDMYYAPATRFCRNFKYLGIYSDKCVKAIGELINISEIEYIDNNFKVISSKHPIDKTTEEKIKKIIEEAKKYEHNLTSGHKFFIVEKFHSVEFIKSSQYGLQGKKYFDLREYIPEDQITSAENIAKLLKDKEW